MKDVLREMEVRTYSTTGKFVDSQPLTVLYPSEVDLFVETFVYSTKQELEFAARRYKVQGKLDKQEDLAQTLRTNISIRDPKTGRFLPWSVNK